MSLFIFQSFQRRYCFFFIMCESWVRVKSDEQKHTALKK
ncbi:hypothetical protein BAME_11450 [Bacillus sp. M 2-6]|nr:hypothetical protein BAME_11450 [Bacillus sp. M 2-6]